MIYSQMAKGNFGQKKIRKLKSVTGVPFVITYHPKFREIASIIKKYQNILYQDETVKPVFTPFLMVSYRNARRLSSYLARAKLYLSNGKETVISLVVADVRCVIILRKLKHLQP